MHVVVVGSGGVIGSHFVPHLARMDAIVKVTLIDRDRYELANLRSQELTPGYVGQPKAEVQGRALRERRPDIAVVAIHSAIETVPRWKLHGDLIASCLDARRPRQVVSEVAMELGVPHLDAGVEAGGLLARVSVYPASEDRVCMECAWGAAEYRALSQAYPCAGVQAAFPTGAPSGLGALAAARLALACTRILAGDGSPEVPREIVIDAAHDVSIVTRLHRNAECRLPSHEPIADALEVVSMSGVTFGDLLVRAFGDTAAHGVCALQVRGMRFLVAFCSRCEAISCPRLEGSAVEPAETCPECGARLEPRLDLRLDTLDPRRFSKLVLDRTLEDLGLRHDDLVSVTGPGTTRHYRVEREEFVIDDPKLVSFLRHQEELARDLDATSDLVDIAPLDSPPSRHYLVRLKCRGLVRRSEGCIVEEEGGLVGISFSLDHLRVVNPLSLLVWLGPGNAFHPNLDPASGAICIGPIAPATGIDELLERIVDVVSYTKSTVTEWNALNPAACAWARARENYSRFPIDRRPLRWKSEVNR